MQLRAYVAPKAAHREADRSPAPSGNYQYCIICMLSGKPSEYLIRWQSGVIVFRVGPPAA